MLQQSRVLKRESMKIFTALRRTDYWWKGKIKMQERPPDLTEQTSNTNLKTSILTQEIIECTPKYRHGITTQNKNKNKYEGSAQQNEWWGSEQQQHTDGAFVQKGGWPLGQRLVEITHRKPSSCMTLLSTNTPVKHALNNQNSLFCSV